MKPWLRHLPAVLGLALLGGAIYVVMHEFRSLSIADIKAALAAIPSGRLWAAFGWTLLAYAILTIYDRLGTIYAGRPVSSPGRRAMSRRATDPSTIPISGTTASHQSTKAKGEKAASAAVATATPEKAR